jgi:cytochrome c-type biogenesis protein CcmH
MALFWIVAGTMAGVAALLVMLAARRASGRSGEDPTLRLHHRQLAEIDDLAERGLLTPETKAAARAEAARRLLSAAGRSKRPEVAGGRRSRLIAAGSVLLAAATALGLYLIFGAPGVPDQPYKARVAAWRASNPTLLGPERLAAVMRQIAATRPKDPLAQGFLGRAELDAGDPYAARKAFARAAALAPGRADLQTDLGEALAAGAEGMQPEDAGPAMASAQAAFTRALALNPKSAEALFALGRLQIETGNPAAGLGRWRTLLAELPEADPQRAALAAAIARVQAGGPIAPPAQAALPGAETDTGAFIRGMVASLASRLAAKPDDPEGWARLVRAYGVLHDIKAQGAALAKARGLFASRPAALQTIEAEAKAHPAG